MAGDIVIRVLASASSDWTPRRPTWIGKDSDVEAHDGLGFADLTADIAEAMRFEDESRR